MKMNSSIPSPSTSSPLPRPRLPSVAAVSATAPAATKCPRLHLCFDDNNTPPVVTNDNKNNANNWAGQPEVSSTWLDGISKTGAGWCSTMRRRLPTIYGFVLGRLTLAWKKMDDAMISCIFAGTALVQNSHIYPQGWVIHSESIIDSSAEMRTLVCPL